MRHLFSLLFLASCTTISMTSVENEGESSSVIEETQTQTPKTDVSASVPASLIP
jgi:hypothetical protein